jgi:predicted nucleic acid-binding protein
VIVLDASVVIAHLDGTDTHHAAATALLLRAAGEDLLMHPLTLAESLVGAAWAGRADDVLADLRRLGLRQARVDEGQAVRLPVLRATTRLRLPDRVVLDTARQEGASLATFDRTLADVALLSQVPLVERPA